MPSTLQTTSLPAELGRRLSPETLQHLVQSLTTSITNQYFLNSLKRSDVLTIYYWPSLGQDEARTFLRLFKRPKTKG